MKQLNENLKSVVKILADGIAFESVKGKDYTLQDKLILLDVQRVKKNLRYKDGLSKITEAAIRAIASPHY